ncbi:isoprenylcysteine carboxylmethyltransferase family protein [Yoonia sp. SS1-5]|uniref:Isoprenylcysteine carboxylmethyltransferase family protein n=1 Tax=Yoonia rhodophyticola TaxID=3137370 RepID=A0AAN0NHI7_9RHOB
MPDAFREPFAAPPTIFGVSLLAAILMGLVIPWPVFPALVQFTFGPGAIVGGVILIRQSMHEIGAANTTYDPFAASTALVTSGIYRRTRNPGYLGLAVIQLGLAILINNFWIVLTCIVAVIVTTLFVIKLEEEKLFNAFGRDYADYCGRVRRWI